MLSSSEYIGLDALALADGLQRREFSVTELVQVAVAQAERLNPAFNAINHSCFERALAQAEAFAAKPALLRKSPVTGLPFLVKDLSHVKTLPTSFGSRLFENHIAERNSNIVEKYMDAGLIVLGKTNTPEFGLTLTTEPVANGVTRNPWNPDYSTGGSSGGAAAAVAAGIVPVAHASDGGGSIRIPAACCGLFGLKPSRGLTVIEDRLGECWSGMSVGHVVSRTVRDSAAFLDLITLSQPNLFPLPSAPASFYQALETPLENLRIGLQLCHPQDESLDADCIAAVRQSAALCQSLGHEVEEIIHPLDYGALIAAMSRLINTHVFQAIEAQLAQRGLTLEEAPLESSTRVMAERGREVTAATYLAARDALKQAERRMAQFHNTYDVILSPVLAKTPARLGWLDMNAEDLKEYGSRFRRYSGFTALYNGTGQPSMSMPLYHSSEGLPVGVMFSAAWGRDLQLLQLARQLEQAQPWPLTAPV